MAPAEKASLLGPQYDSKKCREQFVTPWYRFPQCRCNSLAFRTPVLLRLLLDLDTYEDVDPLGVFPLFLKMVADIIAPKLNIIFLETIRWGSFPKRWRSANAAAIPNDAPSPDTENYPPISITPVLSMVYEKLVSHKLSNFLEKYVFLLAAQFAHRKGMGFKDELLTISHHLQ